jgi:aromatic ring hydroxylase
VLDAVTAMGLRQDRIAAAEAYRNCVADTGRFVTFSSGGTVAGGHSGSTEDLNGCRVVGETSDGVVVSGFLGVHTAVPFANDVFVYGGRRADRPEDRCWFTLHVGSPGVKVFARHAASGTGNRQTSPLSSRYDELDAAVRLDNVLIPWNRVFMFRDNPVRWRHDAITGWICWHQVIGWLARAEFTLGLALALTDSGGAAWQRDRLLSARREIMSLVVDAETVRACLTAAELAPEQTGGGYLQPRMVHVGCAAVYCMKARERMNGCLRRLAGSAPLVAPSEEDLADADVGPELARAFSGGGYTASQRSALLHLTWDHISSSLNGREESFELLSSGGIEAWTRRVQQSFSRYNDLANAALRAAAVEMPTIDLHSLQDLSGEGATRPASHLRASS